MFSPSLDGQPLNVFSVNNPVQQKEVLLEEQTVPNDELNTVHLSFQEPVRWVTLRSGYVRSERTPARELYVLAGDTLMLVYAGEDRTWHIIKGKSRELNNTVSAIDSIADAFLFRLIGRPVSSGAIGAIRQLGEEPEIREAVSAHPFLATYLHYKRATLEIALKTNRTADLVQRYFNTFPSFVTSNPAWTDAFHLLFDHYIEEQFRLRHGNRLLEAFITGHPADAFLEALKSDTVLKNDTLLQWVFLNSLSEMRFSKNIPPKQLLLLVQDFKGKGITPEIESIAQELAGRISSSIRGTTIPDFSFTDAFSEKLFSLSGMKGKPVYISYYPELNRDCIRQLVQLNVLHERYEKDLRFVVIVGNAGLDELKHLAAQHRFRLLLTSLSSCDPVVSSLFESLWAPSFLLTDRYGNVWQSPAEGPETGVEVSFQGVIKMK